MPGVCCYVVDGECCLRDATEDVPLTLRTDPPCPDTLLVPLCHWHAQAVRMWVGAVQVRESEARHG